jgi:uncharacterized membrane protein HdeD (DUF308 family)
MGAWLTPFVLGAIAFGYFLAALFFLRFYRDTKDALFVYFATAFIIEGVNRTLFAASSTPNEARPALYVIRAVAYGLILLGVYRKNR